MTEATGVAGLEIASGATFANIQECKLRTEERLQQRRLRFASELFDPDSAVVLTGSWGRREVTGESDDDYMVLFAGRRRRDARPSVHEAADILEAKPPGREAVFGKQVWLQDLLRKIGRDRDTNANLTRRMLLLLESVSVSGIDVHERARRAVLEEYLRAHKDYRPPRFLLNDLVRYWRTIAVDFESKMRDRKGQGWGLRNAKLRLSRKALFAGGLLPVLECYRYRADGMLEYLDAALAMRPLDRIADAFTMHRAIDPAVRTLGAYDEFLGILNDPDKRKELDTLTIERSGSSQLFARVVELGEDFELGLLALLFNDSDLQRRVRDYLIF
ncbi:MAG TPA: DUF294 nucleotidyltransferase-like domain-containing protein [Solirubrobacteraceae bacterium]|nr:DUF294 nucleotidyltransferase-like domain-containing protein [Solirubrobacteraceae bacterium]